MIRVSKRYGYGVRTEPGKPVHEEDTFTCVHCNAVQTLAPYQAASESGGWCPNCAAPVCSACAGKACRPFEKWLLEVEAKDRMLRSILG